MSELLLCKQSIAAMPYYEEAMSINLYSIEELCYYIKQNLYVLDSSFMTDELCTWIDKELNMEELSQKLKEIMRAGEKLSDFIKEILSSSYYLTAEEKHTICDYLEEMEQLSDFECNKIRADRFMEKEKYLSAIYEYKRLLASEDIVNENVITVGNLWHNLGTAYARLFLFDEAIACYKHAYIRNGDRESLKEQLIAYRCLHDEAGYLKTALENQMTEETMNQIANEISLASSGASFIDFVEQTKKWKELLACGNRKQYQQEINLLITTWKNDYRRISRV